MGIWTPGPGATGGADTYTGDGAIDNVDGLGGDDTLLGLGGNDSLTGGGGNDTLRGGDGGDALDGGGGDDLLDGGGHGLGNRDTATYANAGAGVTVDLQIAGPQNTVGAGTDTLTAIDALTGSAFTDTFNGSDPVGEFFFDQLGGADQFFGNGGDDNLSIARPTSGDAVVLDGGDGADSLSFSGRTTQAGPDPTATIRGGLKDDFLSVSGRTGLVDVDGGDGADLFRLDTSAIAGVIVFDGSSPTATATRDGVQVATVRLSEFYVILSGTGADSLTGGATADTLTAGGGDDLLRGLSGNDVLMGGTGVNRLEGGDGRDVASYSDAAAGVTVNLLLPAGAQSTGVSTDTLIDIESLTGSAFSDSLTGDAGDNTLLGGGGADVLHGFAQDDVLTGGAGPDTLYGGSGSDTFVITFAGESTPAGYDNIVDFSAGDLLAVNNFTGAGSTITLQQRFGCTFVYIDQNGDGAFDAEVVGQGFGLTPNRISTGTQGYRFTVYGSSEAGDALSGGANGDVLAGFEGADTLAGGGGADQLYGGAGADVFRYGAVSDSTLTAYDYIQDFQVGSDKLDLRALNTSGASTFLISQFGGSSFVYVDQNGDNTVDFVVVASGVTLTNADVQWVAAAPEDGWLV